jgi:septum formation protein
VICTAFAGNFPAFRSYHPEMDSTAHSGATIEPREGTARLYLASTSPRRAELLRRHEFAFETVNPGVDDGLLEMGPVTPTEWVIALAHIKARGGQRRLGQDAARAVVLGSDTVVVKAGRVIGQPRDAEHARSIIQTLENGSHEVLTGVALLAPGGRRRLFADRASVNVGTIGEDRIEKYIASEGWRGKAGAYNLEERLAEAWPIEYTGDPGTITGLPMRVLAPILSRELDALAALP